MDKRFQKIGMMLPDPVSDCPLEIKDVSLWSDTENGVLFISPTFVNGYAADLREFSIGYEATDAEGNVVETEHAYRIDDFDKIAQGEEFGDDMPITLQEENVVSGRFYIEEAIFADGYIWQNENVTSERLDEKTEENPDVTTVQTIGGFGPEGPLFRRVPLSKVIAQRLTSQFVTTVIAIVLCVFTLSQNIAVAMKSDKEMVDMLVSSKEVTDLLITAFEGESAGEKSDEEFRQYIEQKGLADTARQIYIVTSVLLGISILYSVYMSFYLRETRKHLRENTVTDKVLGTKVKKLKKLSIIELVICFVCSFNIFGLFAGISGISTASLHKKVMKKKQSGQV